MPIHLLNWLHSDLATAKDAGPGERHGMIIFLFQESSAKIDSLASSDDYSFIGPFEGRKYCCICLKFIDSSIAEHVNSTEHQENKATLADALKSKAKRIE